MQKKKLKNIIRSRHFSSCFFILTLLSTILFFVSTLLSIWQNNLQLKEQLEAKADAAYSNMENTFSVMKVGSVFIAKLASVNHILVSPYPTIDYFSRMISDISPYTQLYSFETICLYFDRSERVFDSSGGMYTYSDFYNPDFLQILSEMDTEEAWVVNIPYERYYSPRPAVPVVVYATVCLCIPPSKAISQFPMPCGSCAGMLLPFFPTTTTAIMLSLPFAISLSMPRMQLCTSAGILLCPLMKMKPCFFPIIMPILPFRTPIRCSVPTMCPPQSSSKPVTPFL